MQWHTRTRACMHFPYWLKRGSPSVNTCGKPSLAPFTLHPLWQMPVTKSSMKKASKKAYVRFSQTERALAFQWTKRGMTPAEIAGFLGRDPSSQWPAIGQPAGSRLPAGGPAAARWRPAGGQSTRQLTRQLQDNYKTTHKTTHKTTPFCWQACAFMKIKTFHCSYRKYSIRVNLDFMGCFELSCGLSCELSCSCLVVVL